MERDRKLLARNQERDSKRRFIITHTQLILRNESDNESIPNQHVQDDIIRIMGVYILKYINADESFLHASKVYEG